MISIKDLTYKYDRAVRHLEFPDWEVAKGSHALILGASGGGKTTLLHLLAGFLRPNTGSIEIIGTEIQQLKNNNLDSFRGAHIGFVFQKPHLLSSLTVKENVRLATYFGHRNEKSVRIEKVLSELGIGGLSDRKVHQISQGQAQRVAIARAVINEPDIIFGDEPTASLDDHSCQSVVDLLKTQAKRCNASLVIATHDQRIKDQFPNQLRL